jgi:hypothetical protein
MRIAAERIMIHADSRAINLVDRTYRHQPAIVQLTELI